MKSLRPIGTTALIAALLAGIFAGSATANEKKFNFNMARGAKLVASGCLPNATARVSIKPGWTCRGDGCLGRGPATQPRL
jgi:hypothetical protein